MISDVNYCGGCKFEQAICYSCVAGDGYTEKEGSSLSIEAAGGLKPPHTHCRSCDPYHYVPTSEADPHGKQPNEAGAKLDAGKNRVGLVLFGFARALQEVSEVGTYGANKYTDSGWVEVPDGERRYTDAMLRHLLREAAGEERDPDTGLRHAAHAAWNALARLDLMLRAASTGEPCQGNGSLGMPPRERGES